MYRYNNLLIHKKSSSELFHTPIVCSDDFSTENADTEVKVKLRTFQLPKQDSQIEESENCNVFTQERLQHDEPSDLSIKDQLFEKNLRISGAYLIDHLIISAFVLCVIHLFPNYLANFLWPLYWCCQGVAITRIWTLARKWGQKAYQNSKTVDIDNVMDDFAQSWNFKQVELERPGSSVDVDMCY